MIDLINCISYIIILKQFVQNNNTLAVRKEVIPEWFNELTQYFTWNAASLCIVIKVYLSYYSGYVLYENEYCNTITL